MRILLTGARGQIGFELQRTLAPLGEVVAFDRAGLDLADPSAIAKTVRAVAPTSIVNAGAYTAVDQAESEPERAMAVNGIAPGILAEEGRRLGACIVHYSTDYVFDGEKQGAYIETDRPNPLSVYGRTKLAGERAVADSGAPFLILRTSWVYGERGRNFLLTIRRLALERRVLRVVNDQFGAPTWSRLVAEATALMLARSAGAIAELSGIYHLTCSGRASWYEFARALLPRFVSPHGVLDVAVEPVATADYPTSARRPRNSLLSNQLASSRFGITLPAWELGLALCAEDGNVAE